MMCDAKGRAGLVWHFGGHPAAGTYYILYLIMAQLKGTADGFFVR